MLAPNLTTVILPIKYTFLIGIVIGAAIQM